MDFDFDALHEPTQQSPATNPTQTVSQNSQNMCDKKDNQDLINNRNSMAEEKCHDSILEGLNYDCNNSGIVSMDSLAMEEIGDK